MSRSTLILVVALITECATAGGDWRIETVYTGGGQAIGGRWTSIAVTPAGTPRIAFEAFGSVLYDVAPWGGSEIVTGIGLPRMISMDIDPNENPFFAFTDEASFLTDETAIVGSYPGGLWQFEFNGGLCSGQASLKIDDAGNAHLAFVDDPDCDGAGCLYYATNASGAWEVEGPLSCTVWNPVNRRIVSLDLALGSFPRIAYVGSFGRLNYRARTPDGSWQVQVVVEPPNHGIEHIALAVSDFDQPHIAYYYEPEQAMKYATFFFGEWIIETADTDGVNTGWYPSIAIDSEQNPHISSYGVSSVSLRYAHRSSGGAWTRQTVDTVSDVGRYSSIALDAYDNIHISYYDALDVQLMYANWSDCNGNGVHDDDDIASGTLDDCNGNNVPDSCETEFGFADDCNDNGVPDSCDTDCDNNGVPDDCDDWPDCNGNGVPDECDADCNVNQIPDDCDIDNGTSLDCDGNGVPDECEDPEYGAPTYTEVTESGDITGAGVPRMTWGDYDDDGDLDLVIAGSDGAGGSTTTLYRNDGDWTFNDAGVDLVGLYQAAMDFGDYDGDGDLDLVTAGTLPDDTQASYLYRNDGGTFVDIAAGLPGLDGSVTWGDFDNDGDLDLLMSGGYDNEVAYLFRNDDGVFTDTVATLPGVLGGDSAWGDYDGDGDLDILITGRIESQGNLLLTRIYRNDQGIFTDIAAVLPGLYDGSIAWGDYDADGDLDILLAGSTGFQQPLLARVYRNDAGVFTDIQADLRGGWDQSIAWGDYDNDGDLDIMIHCTSAQFFAEIWTDIYLNDAGTFVDTGPNFHIAPGGEVSWGDYDNDGDLDMAFVGWHVVAPPIRLEFHESTCARPNTPPAPPTNLVLTSNGNSHTFSWDPAVDDDTPSSGLTYNLRIGTAPGAGDIMPAMANPSTGSRHVAEWGNTNHALSWTIERPLAGPVYWGVQAIDGAFAGSLFAEGEAPPTCFADLDDSGDVGFPDLLMVLAAWGECEGDCGPEDLDGDDLVGFSDLLIVLSNWGPCP